MKNHTQLKKEQQAELNSFQGIFFAFTNEQFADGMTRMGLEPGETDKILKLPAGGFLLKSRVAAWNEMFHRHESERRNLRKDRKALVSGLAYELANHEYCITGDPTDACNVFNLDPETMDKSILKDAIKLHDSQFVAA